MDCPRLLLKQSPGHPTDICGSAHKKAWRASMVSDLPCLSVAKTSIFRISISRHYSSMRADGCGWEHDRESPYSNRVTSDRLANLPRSPTATSAQLPKTAPGT